LTERGRRIWAATEARAAGRGGITALVRATGIAYSTVVRGRKFGPGREVQIPSCAPKLPPDQPLPSCSAGPLARPPWCAWHDRAGNPAG
jgi:hypothetical protein